MKDDKSRRKFIKQVAAGVSMFTPASKSIASKISNSDKEKGEKSMNDKDSIKQRPLGFQWETLNPFLFCVHHEDFYPAGNKDFGPDASLEGRDIGRDFTIKDGWRMYHGQKVPGFPVHPHRGFETVTIVRKGFVDHSDSLSAAGRYGGGDVQWMTAGKGIQHSEMFPLLESDKGNTLELFQVWLNLPKKSKFVEPGYKMLWSEDIPRIKDKDKNNRETEVTVIAGNYAGAKPPSPPPDSWASDPANQVMILTVRMEEGAEWELPECDEGINRTIYFFTGESITVDGVGVSSYRAVDVGKNSAVHVVNGQGESELLVLQGRPIDEPVVQYGPFVMNTEGEIRQAYLDYQQTEFGGWPWDSNEPVHGGEKGRFAKHADGKIEKPG